MSRSPPVSSNEDLTPPAYGPCTVRLVRRQPNSNTLGGRNNPYRDPFSYLLRYGEDGDYLISLCRRPGRAQVNYLLRRYSMWICRGTI